MAKPFKITGATLYWASLASPNPMSGKYQVDLCKLPKRTVDALIAMKVEVRNKGDDRGFYITAKSQYPILAVDKNGDVIQGNVVGNNSLGDVVCVTYGSKMSDDMYVGVNKLKVTELFEYEGSDGVDMDDVEEL
jgi:hypothetical protein